MTTATRTSWPKAHPTSSRPSRRSSDAERPEAWYRVIWSSKKARVGLIIVALYVLVAIFAPLIAPYDPDRRVLRAAGTAVARTIRWAPTSAARTSCPS